LREALSARLININPPSRSACHGWALGKARGAMMKAGWQVFWLSIVVLAVAFGAERLLVPDVVPVGYAEEPQPSWAVLTAFALRSIELTAEWVAAIALVLLLGSFINVRLRGRKATPPPMRPAD
jgi:hypothetical protein